MYSPNFIILYVNNPLESADFYSKLLGKAPLDASPTFALFDLEHFKFGLWSKHTVEPAALCTGGGTEVAFAVATMDEVTASYTDFCQRGLPILQEPTQMDFGYTFVALDPDGHRLRIFAATE